MKWVGQNTAPSSRVLVITGEPWWRDRTSEWFPVLANRASVATPQGLEWVPNGRFSETRDAHDAVQNCADQSPSCLAVWSYGSGIPYDTVFVSKTVPAAVKRLGYDDCCSALRASLLQDPAYGVVYDGPGATIFASRRLTP